MRMIDVQPRAVGQDDGRGAREGGLTCIGTQAGPPGSGRRLRPLGSGRRLRPLLSAAAVVLRTPGRRLRHGTCRDCR